MGSMIGYMYIAPVMSEFGLFWSQNDSVLENWK